MASFAPRDVVIVRAAAWWLVSEPNPTGTLGRACVAVTPPPSLCTVTNITSSVCRNAARACSCSSRCYLSRLYRPTIVPAGRLVSSRAALESTSVVIGDDHVSLRLFHEGCSAEKRSMSWPRRNQMDVGVVVLRDWLIERMIPNPLPAADVSTCYTVVRCC